MGTVKPRLRLEQFVKNALRGAILAVLMGIAVCAGAQKLQPIHWTATFEPADTRAGEVGTIVVHAEIDKGWHVYALKDTADATPTSFTLPAGPFEAAGDASSDNPIVKFDSNFQANTASFEEKADFRVPVRIKAGTSGSVNAKIGVRYQGCDATRCMRPTTEEVAVTVTVAPGAARPDRTKAAAITSGRSSATPPPSQTPTQAAGTDEFAQKVKAAQEGGPFAFFWFAFTYGLAALLTPCVFPMIPITVSYFTKERKDGGKTNYKGASAYCLGIIGTFTGLGLVMTALFGATGISKLATNPWVNLALALLFLVLAANLMGLFEIRLPSGMVNKIGAKSRSGGGLLGPILMGLTFSLTSFTCTVPFVGTILAAAAKEGNYLNPTIGMLAFSLAFALPFFLLAMFPQLLAKLPKSGGWLATVKVFMGFLEVAAALKFLSNADLVWQAGWLTRSVFLALWAAIGILGGLYLLGAIRLPHDDPETKIGWPRRGFGLATLGAAVLCLAGIQGRPLGKFSAFLPPEPYPGQSTKGELYAWGDSYDAALATAKQTHRNVFIDFTGVSCTNCRYMEDNIFPLPSVHERFDQFVLVRLYTDRPTKSDEANAVLQDKIAKVSTLPCYVMISPEGKVLKVHQQQPGLNDEEQFVGALDVGLGKRLSAR